MTVCRNWQFLNGRLHPPAQECPAAIIYRHLQNFLKLPTAAARKGRSPLRSAAPATHFRPWRQWRPPDYLPAPAPLRQRRAPGQIAPDLPSWRAGLQGRRQGPKIISVMKNFSEKDPGIVRENGLPVDRQRIFFYPDLGLKFVRGRTFLDFSKKILISILS